MATLRDNPYSGFRLLVCVGDDAEQGGSGRVVTGFSEVTGLGTDADLSDYRHSGRESKQVRKIPGTHKFGLVTLKRGVMHDADLLQWIEAGGEGAAKPRRLRITMLDEARNTVATFTLHNARPAKCTARAFDAKGNGTAIEELCLAHEGIEIA